ncbi:MAG: hypothetical protein HQL38_20750 [Alphaproteobacteria bacterium]|nr:hypothetical protein [Alphaproteobacteria bacterium]
MMNKVFYLHDAGRVLGGMTWARFERLRFIEERINWHGALSRDDLVARFGVTPGIVTRDIAAYQTLCGRAGVENMTFDTRLKRFSRTRSFHAILGDETPESWLDRALANEDGPVADLPPPGRSIEPCVLRHVLRAIDDRETVTFTYVSENGEAVRRGWSVWRAAGTCAGGAYGGPPGATSCSGGSPTSRRAPPGAAPSPPTSTGMRMSTSPLSPTPPCPRPAAG